MVDEENRQPIDVINFALLAFLSDRPRAAKELRDLLKQYTQQELSKTPFYRRMRGLVDSAYVSEEKVDAFGTAIYRLTEAGKKYCLEWTDTLRLLVGLASYTLEYTKTEEYANESK